MNHALQVASIVATALFILSLHWMNDPKTARRAVRAGTAGMVVAVLAAMLAPGVTGYLWIVIAMAAGTLVGVPLSQVSLTAVPQRTALSHAFGGLAAGLVGTAKFFAWYAEGALALTPLRTVAIIAEVILGFLTFTGSLMAAGKLQEIKWIPQRPVTYPGQNVVNIGLLVAAVGLGGYLVYAPTGPYATIIFPVILGLSLVFGVFLVIPIGGADMPTVISILNVVRGPLGGGHGIRPRQQAAHHGRRARRIVGAHPVHHHVPGHEPLVRQRAFRRFRPGAGQGDGRRAEGLQVRDHRGRCADPRAGEPGGDRAGLRHGGGPGPAQGARALRPAEEAGDRR